MPIGKHLEVKSDFKTHHIKLNDGDKIYLFTDGFADQFGGSGNKKYLSKRFVDFLKNLSETPPTSNQAETLAAEFETWRTNNEQTDDVLVFGMQYTERMTEKKTVKHLYSLA
jgi:serine phosphatase RsbU (regulator of sigma subunit)